MPKVDFYSISQTTLPEQQFFACRLVEQLFNQGMKVYIHTESAAAAQAMDDLLWSFRPDSFIPHTLVSVSKPDGNKPSDNKPNGAEPEEGSEIPVLIGHDAQYSGIKQVLINLDPKVPEFHADFERIVEIVINDDAAKKSSREHWNSYKAAGYTLKHNKV